MITAMALAASGSASVTNTFDWMRKRKTGNANEKIRKRGLRMARLSSMRV